MKIGSKSTADGSCLLVAELSANHLGDKDRALALVDAAAQAGADAVKLQTYTPDTITIDCDKPAFQIRSGTLWDGTTLHALYKEAYTPWEWHEELYARARSHGLECFSSPFDDTAVDFLESLDTPAYKIASFELVDLPLIAKAAGTGKPLIMSTGMATLEEIDEAVTTARAAGCRDLALLVCSSAYPSPPELINLKRLEFLRNRYQCHVGLSDHTSGIAVAVAATALGAVIVEKHLTLARSDGGPDAPFSLEPDELAELASSLRTASAALGSVSFGNAAEDSSRGFRRSLFAVRPIRKGERFTSENVRSIRPANGLHTRYLPQVLKSRASTDLDRGTPLALEHLEPLPPSATRQ